MARSHYRVSVAIVNSHLRCLSSKMSGRSGVPRAGNLFGLRK